MNQQKPKTPKSIPSQLQLPGGIILKAIPFKVVEYHPDGSPKLFELLPPDNSYDINKSSTREGTCVLFASEQLLRRPWKDPAGQP